MLTIIMLVSTASAQQRFPQNSLQKIRIEPSTQADRIGSAVDWQPDFETALAKSRSTGKPVFWYVPTLRGSFMDRLDSIDRYMLAGPFSWPDIIAVLNLHYIPVKVPPNVAQQQKYQLKPYVFVEPGFLILDRRGEPTLRVDRLTTLHLGWFRHRLTQDFDYPALPFDKPSVLDRGWREFRAGNYLGFKFDADAVENANQTEALLLAGMFDFRRGDHAAAKQHWHLASLAQPDHPLAWKAAAEAEGFGPFVRGFEIHRNLPASAYVTEKLSTGSTAPSGLYSADDIWRRSTEFLLGMQNENGGFTDSDYDFGGTDSLPNIHAAVTSIAGMALLDAQARFPDDSVIKNRIDDAVNRSAEFVVNDQNLNFADRDELIWACAYRIRLISRLVNDNPTYRERLRSMLIDLKSLQLPAGGWYHEYNNPFVTATVLLALKDAERVGVVSATEVIQKGISSLARDRYHNGAFPYLSVTGLHRSVAGNREVVASAGRMPLCELALWSWHQSSDLNLSTAVQRSFDLNEHLMSALKYDDHTSNMAYGGFFFWYDVQGRSEAISIISDENLKAEFQRKQRALILSLPEIDGCFVDSHELGRVYGTAMALLSLADCE